MQTFFQDKQGRPLLVTGVQCHNSSTGSAMLQDAIKVAKEFQGNVLEAPVYWYLLEPEQGVYDTTHVRELIHTVREAGLHLVILWFATSKNGHPNYVPEYVKLDPETYRLAVEPDGLPVPSLSPHCRATLEADKRAFVELMKCVREEDQDYGTVLAIQVENEAGLAGTDRDYSKEAQADFEKGVPQELAGVEIPDSGASGKDNSWRGRFGRHANEACTAWYQARYIGEIAAAGKEVYDLPMYVNVMLGAKVTEETSTNDSAKKLVDGDYGTKWDVVTANEDPGPCPHWAILDMGEVKSIDKIKVLHANSHPSQPYDENPLIATYDFDVSYSVDGENWTTTEIRANTDPTTTIDFGETVEARYVKIYVITPNAGTEENGFDSQYKAIRILEVEALQSITEDIDASEPVTLYEGDQKLDSFDAAKGKTVDVKVDTEATYQGKVNVVAATYSDNGALLNVKSVAVDVDETGAIDCTLSDFAVSQDAAKMNVFFWAANTQAPISEAILVG